MGDFGIDRYIMHIKRVLNRLDRLMKTDALPNLVKFLLSSPQL